MCFSSSIVGRSFTGPTNVFALLCRSFSRTQGSANEEAQELTMRSVTKRPHPEKPINELLDRGFSVGRGHVARLMRNMGMQALYPCLLYTSDAADDLLCVDLGGRRII